MKAFNLLHEFFLTPSTATIDLQRNPRMLDVNDQRPAIIYERAGQVDPDDTTASRSGLSRVVGVTRNDRRHEPSPGLRPRSVAKVLVEIGNGSRVRMYRRLQLPGV